MTTQEHDARQASWWHTKLQENIRRTSRTARQHYAEQQEAARTANYRVCWSQDRGGYFAQWRPSEGNWQDVGPVRTHDSYASLDAKLNAQQGRTHCNLHPLIANLTEGRKEYDVDLNLPYPGWTP